MFKITVNKKESKQTFTIFFEDGFYKDMVPRPSEQDQKKLAQHIAQKLFEQYSEEAFQGKAEQTNLNLYVKRAFYRDYHLIDGSNNMEVLIYSSDETKGHLRQPRYTHNQAGIEFTVNTDSLDYSLETATGPEKEQATKRLQKIDEVATSTVAQYSTSSERRKVIKACKLDAFLDKINEDSYKQQLNPINNTLAIGATDTENRFRATLYKQIISNIDEIKLELNAVIEGEKKSLNETKSLLEIDEKASEEEAITRLREIALAKADGINQLVADHQQQIKAKLVTAEESSDAYAKAKQEAAKVLDSVIRLQSKAKTQDQLGAISSITDSTKLPADLQDIIPNELYQELAQASKALDASRDKLYETTQDIQDELEGVAEDLKVNAKQTAFRGLTLNTAAEKVATYAKTINETKDALKNAQQEIEANNNAISSTLQEAAQHKKAVAAIHSIATITNLLVNSGISIAKEKLMNDDNINKSFAEIDAEFRAVEDTLKSLPRLEELQKELREVAEQNSSNISEYLESASENLKGKLETIRANISTARQDANQILLAHVYANVAFNLAYWSDPQRCTKESQPSLVMDGEERYFVPKFISELIDTIKDPQHSGWNLEPQKARQLLDAMENSLNKNSDKSKDALFLKIDLESSREATTNDSINYSSLIGDRSIASSINEINPDLLPNHKNLSKIHPLRRNQVQPTKENFFQRNPTLTGVLIGVGIGLVVAGAAVGITIATGGFGALALAIGVAGAAGVLGGGGALLAAIGGFLGGIISKLTQRKPQQVGDYVRVDQQQGLIDRPESDEEFDDSFDNQPNPNLRKAGDVGVMQEEEESFDFEDDGTPPQLEELPGVKVEFYDDQPNEEIAKPTRKDSITDVEQTRERANSTDGQEPKVSNTGFFQTVANKTSGMLSTVSSYTSSLYSRRPSVEEKHTLTADDFKRAIVRELAMRVNPTNQIQINENGEEYRPFVESFIKQLVDEGKFEAIHHTRFTDSVHGKESIKAVLKSDEFKDFDISCLEGSKIYDTVYRAQGAIEKEDIRNEDGLRK